jgi:hypothetical protein
VPGPPPVPALVLPLAPQTMQEKQKMEQQARAAAKALSDPSARCVRMRC